MISLFIIGTMIITLNVILLTESYDTLVGLFASMGVFIMLVSFTALSIFANPGGNRRKLIKNILISSVLPVVFLLLIEPLIAILQIIAFLVVMRIASVFFDGSSSTDSSQFGTTWEEQGAQRVRAYDDPNSTFYRLRN